MLIFLRSWRYVLNWKLSHKIVQLFKVFLFPATPFTIPLFLLGYIYDDVMLVFLRAGCLPGMEKKQMKFLFGVLSLLDIAFFSVFMGVLTMNGG